MPDYTSILKRSIAALPEPNGEMREAVYQRARAALARQLTAVDPPLSGREIERQHQDLEEAVARLEAEYSPEAESIPQAVAPAAEDDVFAPEPPIADAIRSEPARRSDPDSRDVERRSDFEDDDDGDDDDEYEDDDHSASRTPLLAGLLMLVLVVGGAAAYAYAERESLMSFLGMSGEEQQVAVGDAEPIPAAAPEPAPPVIEPAEADEADKRPDRLTNGSESPPAPAPLDEPVLAEPEPPALILPDESEATATPLPSESPPGIGAEQTGAEQSPAGQTAALDPPDEPISGSIVAQRAIYYFQGQEGSPGQATEGTVAWAEITRDNAPAVQATLRLAEQNVTTTVTIYKNNDSTLPASHLVEVQFSGDVGSSPIQRVPALVLKQTEQARGQPLTGAAVPVTEDLFWIALSDDQEQIVRNLQLLREGSWFDIPILFNDGTRALLTFEKGIPGDKVFETVMSAWTPA